MGRHEAVEYCGKKDLVLDGICLDGDAPTLIRLIDCRNVIVRNCKLARPKGPPDPDGQCLQLIRTTGLVEDCTFTAGNAAEDLLSLFGDKPVKGAVLVRRCAFLGRGKSDSGTSLCIDGPYPPVVTVQDCEFSGARVGIMVAGGSGHIAQRNRFRDCHLETAVMRCYKGGPWGGFKLEGKVWDAAKEGAKNAR